MITKLGKVINLFMVIFHVMQYKKSSLFGISFRRINQQIRKRNPMNANKNDSFLFTMEKDGLLLGNKGAEKRV